MEGTISFIEKDYISNVMLILIIKSPPPEEIKRWVKRIPDYYNIFFYFR